MKRSLRRIASLLCALSLCLTLLPGMARAEDTSPLPEEPAAIECICQIPCTEDAVNPECPLCSMEGADLTLCLGVVPETPAEEPTEPEAPAGEPADEIPAEEPTEPEIPVEEPEEDVEGEPVDLPAEEVPAEELAEEDVPSEADTVPEVTDMSITHNGSPVNRDVVNGSYIFTFPTTTASNPADYTASVTLSEGSMFTASSPADDNTGELYVEEVNGNEVTLKFNMTVDVVDLNDDEYALTLVSAGSNTWTGGFENATDLPLTTMATYLTSRNIYLTAGALGSGSEAQDILVNMDDEKVVFVLCNPDAVVYTVDYVVDEDTTITWELPAGAEIPEIAVELSGGQEIEGWYTDADCTNAFVEGTTVTGNTTVYAKVSAPTEDKTFLEKLEDHEDVTITNKTEWDTFVENSDVVVAGQLITLGADIDCGNAIYDAMTFKGDFNGNGKTISNATFRAVDSAYYNSTESDIVCSGMFAALGAGQTIANLTLEDITAEFSTTYSGVLAGLADGTSSNPVLIQNVQVRDSSASGRTAAGVVGFTRNTTVRYCSSTGTTITGLANGGGVVGINNAHVEYCYSTSTPTALTFLGGSVGGVISKNVRGGNNNYCWAYMQVVGAEEDGPGQNLNSFIADEDMDIFDFEDEGFDQACWMEGDNTPVDFDPDVVTYDF